MALPGAMIARRFNYQTGVLVGLGIYAAGCGLLYPALLTGQFAFFCLAMAQLSLFLAGSRERCSWPISDYGS